MCKHLPFFFSRFNFVVPFILFLFCFSPIDVEAQWWKFWKKRDKVSTTQSVESDAPAGRNLKDVEKERKTAEKVLEKESKKQLRDEKKRQEELAKAMRDSQKAIEKNQKKVLADHRKQQRKIMRNIKSKNSNHSVKGSSFLQRYKSRKNSSDGFFLNR